MGGNIQPEEEELELETPRAQTRQPQYQQEEEMEAEALETEDNYAEEPIVTEVEVTDESYEAAVPVQTTYEPVEYETEEQAPTRNDAPNEEWLSDYDGQLNIDMFQTKDNVILKSTIAGVRPEDIDITVANDMVSIKGERKKEDRVNPEDYFYQECYWGNFSRSVIVPVDIDSENIEADLKDGILTIIIPKAAKAKTKKVRVKGA